MEKHYAIPASVLNAIMAFFSTCRPHEVARLIVALDGLKEVQPLPDEEDDYQSG